MVVIIRAPIVRAQARSTLPSIGTVAIAVGMAWYGMSAPVYRRAIRTRSQRIVFAAVPPGLLYRILLCVESHLGLGRVHQVDV